MTRGSTETADLGFNGSFVSTAWQLRDKGNGVEKRRGGTVKLQRPC